MNIWRKHIINIGNRKVGNDVLSLLERLKWLFQMHVTLDNNGLMANNSLKPFLKKSCKRQTN